MNEIKLAILRDMGLNNNGYGEKTATVFRVRKVMGDGNLTEIKAAFDSLVSFGHLKLLGTSGDKEFYCLPESYALIKMMMVDLTTGQ